MPKKDRLHIIETLNAGFEDEKFHSLTTGEKFNDLSEFKDINSKLHELEDGLETSVMGCVDYL